MDAVILAAGKSRKLRPLTSTRPKPMIMVGGKPMIYWDLEALFKSSSEKFERVFIVVGFKQEKIREYLGNKFMDIEIEYIEQKQLLGTGRMRFLSLKTKWATSFS